MKEQTGYKYLFKNIGILTLSQLLTKIFIFFLVPLYTSILSTSEYGIYDLFNTSIGVLIPILTLNIQEAVLRFSMDKNNSRSAIVSISFKYLLISFCCVIVGLWVNSFFSISILIRKYSLLFFLMFAVQAGTGLFTFYIRGLDKIAALAISSIVATIVTVSCNIVFLIIFRWGFYGYIIANITGPLVQCIYLAICSHYFLDVRFKRYEEENKKMVAYSSPLMANSIAWWINSVLDRYVVSFFCGLAVNGIYSIAGKIPAILNMFQSIFNSAWTLSAVKDFDPEDKKNFFSNTYRAYNCLLTLGSSVIIMFDKILARFLYSKEFYAAWKYVPWLTIAILFGALSGYLGGFFSAVKQPKLFAVSTIIGAILNVILNLIFTPIYGAMGAAIATLVCYFTVWLFRYIQSKKYIRLRINICRDSISYILLCLQSVLICMDVWNLNIMVCGIFVLVCLIYIKDMKLLVKIIMKNKNYDYSGKLY